MKGLKKKKIIPVLAITACFSGLPAFSNASTSASSESMSEMTSVLALVKPEAMTHQPVISGDWLDPLTWGGENKVPVAGSRVMIPEGVHLVVNGKIEAELMTLRVNGRLSFATDRDTQLVVDTLVVDFSGELTIGTLQNPVSSSSQARLIIKDGNNGFDVVHSDSPDFDPYKLGQGVIALGRMEVHGAPKQPYVAIPKAYAGEDEIYLEAGIPAGWTVGDQLVIAGARRDALGDELRVIAGVVQSAGIIELDQPLSFDHLPPEHAREGLELKIHVANLTRNVVIETPLALRDRTVTHVSGTVEFTGRGHMMFMHTNNVHIRYAELAGLGRTNKLMKLRDTGVDESGVQTIGLNPRSRYPVHFHRAGNEGEPGLIEGSSVVTSPGWGFVNHSSYVMIKKNIAYDVTGAAFTSEAGDEVGSFEGNLSIKTHGSQTPGVHSERRPRDGNSDDLGHRGDGFWIHSRTVRLEDNIASGFMGTAYTLWGQFEDGAEDRLVGIQFTKAPEDYPPEPGRIPASEVREILPMENNRAYGGYKAMHSGFITGRQEIRGFLGYAVAKGDSRWYSASKTYRNLTLIGDINEPSGTGVGSHVNSGKMAFYNVHIEGFETGFQFSPRQSGSLLEGGYFNNVTDIEFRKRLNYAHTARVRGDVRFGQLDSSALNGRQRAHFHAFTELHGPAGGTG